MTNDEALSWCQKHSVISIHHEQKIVLLVPHERIDVKAAPRRFTLTVEDGYVIAMSDPGDEFHEVVEAARASWKTAVSVVDSLADTVGHRARPARLRFEDQSGLFDDFG
ncbi:MAG TPA: hypothetical protein VFH61_10975 [Thermoleophilia bacterium]|nr:hypothetical protein [Thermoleophilia bacterium]